MKKALIDPRFVVYKNVGYDDKGLPITELIPNSGRVAQVEPSEQTFPVAEPLFWTTCADDCVANQWYYDTVQKECFVVPLAPQPVVSGAQTL